MSGRLCGAPRSTSLTLRDRRRLVKLAWSCDIFIVDSWLVSIPVVAQRLHVNVNSGRIRSSSALGEDNEQQNDFDQIIPKNCSTEKKWRIKSKEDSIQLCMKLTCRQMARLTLEPKAVLTARDDRPRSLKSLEKDCVRERRGRSSAITTQLRTQDRFRPRA